MSVEDAGLRTVEDIYGGLQIDEEWSVRAERSFTWWPYRHAQRVWAEEPVEDDGVSLSLVHVETDAMRGVQSHPHGAQTIDPVLGVLMGQASLAGLVIDGDAVRFHSTILVHGQIQEWASKLIQMAAVVQLFNAKPALGPYASALGLHPDESHPPERGPRPAPDEMIGALNGLPLRDRPWGEQAECEEVSAFLNERGVFSMTSELGFAAEFPYGRNGALHVLPAERALQARPAPQPSSRHGCSDAMGQRAHPLIAMRRSERQAGVGRTDAASSEPDCAVEVFGPTLTAEPPRVPP